MPLTVVDEKFNPSGFQQARSFRSPSELAALFLVNEYSYVTLPMDQVAQQER